MVVHACVETSMRKRMRGRIRAPERRSQHRYPPAPAMPSNALLEYRTLPTQRSWKLRENRDEWFSQAHPDRQHGPALQAPDVLDSKLWVPGVREGLNIELVFVGSGRYQLQLETRAAALRVATRVHFVAASLSQCRAAELDRADLFVLPRRARRGCPRLLMIERWHVASRASARRSAESPSPAGDRGRHRPPMLRPWLERFVKFSPIPVA